MAKVRGWTIDRAPPQNPSDNESSRETKYSRTPRWRESGKLGNFSLVPLNPICHCPSGLQEIGARKKIVSFQSTNFLIAKITTFCQNKNSSKIVPLKRDQCRIS